ncbi:hypothetical protein ACGE0T_01125 [Parabacteroides sp. APC149_11_2_Y6]
METEENKLIEEIVQAEVLDVLSMRDIKAGSSPHQECECDHQSCNNGATLK